LQLGQLKKKLESMVKLNQTLSVERQQLLERVKQLVRSPA
jgi:regulator of replication initiation timing